MKKVITHILKASKIFLLLLFVALLTKVNVTSNASKIENVNLNKTIDLTAMSLKLNEIQIADKYFALDTFTGDLTGYAADCPLCSGYLYCTNQYVVGKGNKYIDKDYGEVVIVASSKNLPCGSILTYTEPYGEHKKVTAIVLDRGVPGNDLDLLVESESYASKYVGRHQITYDVLRFGWTR